MEEIRVRAWDIESKRMLPKIGPGGGVTIEAELDYHLKLKKYGYIFMLYLGLKDDNDNVLCEEDIIELVEETMSQGDVLIRGVVIFENGCVQIDFPQYGTTRHFDMDLGCTIVGNKYETPELMP